MLATNHALAGCLIAAYLPLPAAVPLAFTSHFVLDSLPHYGIRQNQRNKSRTYKLIVLSDFLVCLSIAVSLVLLHKWRMEALGWLSYSPDALWAIWYFKHGRNLQLSPTRRFMRFHIAIQRYERPWGIAVDLAAMTAMMPFFVTQLLN